MKDETDVVAIEKCVGLKLKRHLFLINDGSKHKKRKGVNKNTVATINHDEYKDKF